MPVGTQASVKGMTMEMVRSTGAQIVLGNTYHLHLTAGGDLVEKHGGLAKFSHWNGPMLTDSGGFQVFSLGALNKVTEEGVTFKNPKNGDKILLTPEKSMQIQHKLGADIIMAFDDVVSLAEDGRDPKEAIGRTHRWLDRCIVEHKRLCAERAAIAADSASFASDAHSKHQSSASTSASRQELADPTRTSSSTQISPDYAPPKLFGIFQGGLNKELRKHSIEFINSTNVDGVAIGGLSVGEPRPEMHEMLEYLQPLYDQTRPIYLMGVGHPIDWRFAIEHGIDMADCVLPTRNARHGTYWHGFEDKSDEQFTIKALRFADDMSVLEEGCDCTTCTQKYTRSYVRHLIRAGEPLGGTLLAIHNLRYLQRISESYKA